MAELSGYHGGSGSPLVCLHGLADSWRTWEPILPGLERRHEVLALALPGHIDGPPIPEAVDISVRALADEVENQLDQTGITTAHFVGNSLGGWLSLELASRGRARSVVALSPAGGWYRDSREERRVLRFFETVSKRARLAAPRAELLARLPLARTIGLRYVVGRPANISTAAFAQHIRAAASCTAVGPAIEVLKGGGWEDPLGAIDCPVRIAWGSHDRIIPIDTASRRFHSLVPNAEFVRLEGLGHVPMSDDPELVVETILAVTERLDAHGGAVPVAPARSNN